MPRSLLTATFSLYALYRWASLGPAADNIPRVSRPGRPVIPWPDRQAAGGRTDVILLWRGEVLIPAAHSSETPISWQLTIRRAVWDRLVIRQAYVQQLIGRF